MPNIDEKLLAQILHDAFLLGSYGLEGNTFRNTIGYLNEYISRFYGTQVPGGVKKLQDACNAMMSFQDDIATITKNVESDFARIGRPQNPLLPLVNKIHTHIKQLKGDDYFLMPGGWKNASGGHGIIYQYSLDKNGDLLFSVNNSGAGLEFHEKKLEQQGHQARMLYNPVKVWRIPKNKINDPFFSVFLQELIRCQIPELHQYKEITAKSLYQDISFGLDFLDGQLIQPESPEHWFTGGQISGTCAQRSLHQMLKARFSNRDDYRRFMYGFKMYALSDYLSKNSLVLQDPTQHDLLKSAIKHNLRLLTLPSTDDPDKSLFNVDEKKTGKIILCNFLSQLIRMPYLVPPMAKKFPPETSFSPMSFNPLVVPSFKNTLDSLSDDLQPPIVITAQQDIVAHMDEVTQRCNSLENNHQDLALLEQLESFFLNLPLPDQQLGEPLLGAYASIDSDNKAMAFYQKLNVLQTLYFKTIKRLTSDHMDLPRVILVKMHVFCVVSHINLNWPLVDGLIPAQYFFSDLLKRIIEYKYNQPCTANNVPKQDERFLHICRLACPSKEMLFGIGTDLQYYQNLLNTATKNTDLKKYLKEKYNERYANSPDPLHAACRVNDAEALFYCLEHADELSTENKDGLQTVLFKFQLQREMEIAFHNGQSSTPGLRLEAKKGCWGLPPTLSMKNSLLDPTPVDTWRLINNKYHPSAGTVNVVLQKIAKSHDNLTQIIPITGNASRECEINTEELTARELVHLRQNEKLQIRLTLDYFNQRIEACVNPELMIYIEANLFQPGLLLEELTPAMAPSFFKLFDRFITDGLTIHQKKGLLTQAAIPFIRLACLVNQYAAMHDPAQWSERLSSLNQQIDVFLDASDDPQIKASLHQYRYLAALEHMKLNPDNASELDHALFSFFQINIAHNPHEHLDNDSRFKLQWAQHDMRRCLAYHQDKLTKDRVIEALKQMRLLTENNIDITGKYPVFMVSGTDLVIHVDQGLVYKNALACRRIPEDIRLHPVVKQLGLNNLNYCFASTDSQLFEIQQPSLELQFIRVNNQYSVKKKWKDSQGNLTWFQLVALNKPQQETLQLPSTDICNTLLPKTIQEQRSLAWARDDNKEWLITDSNQQLLYRGAYSTLDTSKFQFHDIQNDAVLCQTKSSASYYLYPTWIHQRLSAIESPDFITVAKKGDDYIATLGRYGLQYTIDGKTDAIHMKWEGKRWQLQEPKLRSWNKDIKQLTLTHEKNTLLVLPVQPFTYTRSRDQFSIYFNLEQDTKALIKDETVKKIPQKMFLSNNLPWQYTNTEQCYILKANNLGEPIPQTPAEALYLCYVYLGTQKPKKAWAILDDCKQRLGGLTGSYDELRYLSWMMDALPRHVEAGNNEANIVNPPFVACKLKAMALLANYSRQDKRVVFPEPLQDEHMPNGIYEREEIKQVKSFYQNFNTTIYQLYTQLQTMRRDMPVYFTLSETSCKTLLNYYHEHVPAINGQPKALGALGYEWVQLQLAALKKEHHDLAAKAQSQKLSSYEAKRKQDIEKFIVQHEGIEKVRSELTRVSIDLRLSSRVTLKSTRNEYGYEEVPKEIQTKNRGDTAEKAMKTPPWGLSDKEFIEYFSTYLALANQKENQHHQQLMNFCEKMIIAHRHTSFEEQTSNIPLLCNVLYHVGHRESPLDLTQFKTYNDLLTCFENQPDPVISIDELVDDTSALRLSTKALWDEQPAPPTYIKPDILKPVLHLKPLSDAFSPALQHLMHTWRKTEKEFQAGEMKYASLSELKKIAGKAFDHNTIKTLKKESRLILQKITIKHQSLKHEILQLAQHGPEDPALKLHMQLDMAADKRPKLSISRLLTLYFHHDRVRYKTETDLEDDAIDHLHTLLANYVDQGLRMQHHQRVQEVLSLPQTTDSKFLLAQTLFAENRVNAVDDPELSLFQLHGNLLLHPQQKDALDRLLKKSADGNYANIIEKIIMGGGKSKIILPTLAQQKATGDNLVVIEVPQALLHTNFVDLNATSNTLFNQNAHIFEFNRDSNCSAKRLEQIYNDLTDVIINKDYLVTTGDALQALELKYLELLSRKPTADQDGAEWSNQILWADHLVSLFRNRADLMIDEVHQSLAIKNKLNFTLGESNRIPNFIVQDNVALYRFLKCVKLKQNTTLDEVLKNNSLLPDDKQCESACQQLAHALVYHEQSPLARFIQTLDESSRAQLVLYLKNQGKHIPDCVRKAPLDTKNRLALYKEQVSFFLPHTLRRHFGEHYGPSKRGTHSPEVRALAIPYVANNVPNERARFENCIETANYTIQSMLCSGIAKDLLRMVLDEMLTEARKDQFKHHYKTLNETEIGQFFNQITFGLKISFDDLDLNDNAQFEKLHTHLQYQEDFIYETLKTHVLKTIRTDPRILHSNAMNKVDQVRSCQGMAGTVDNHSTFHQKLRFDQSVATGTDEYVCHGIKAKQPGISAYSQNILGNVHVDDQLRAVIDIGAMFKGIANETVVRRFAQAIHAHPERFNQPEPLQYILFFNAKNQLSALRIDDEQKAPIIIGPSDPKTIKTRLGCELGACFSYYDQSHTVGADIKQAEQAKALVLVDQDTTIDNFLQGAMRMRGLIAGQQRIDLMVPEFLADCSLDQLLEHMRQNQQRKLQQDNFTSTQLKMANLIRSDLMNRILAVQGEDAPQQKAELFETFKAYFIEQQDQDFFVKYGGLPGKKDSKRLLENLGKNFMDGWKSVLQSAGQAPAGEEEQAMSLAMNNMIQEACKPGMCAEKQMTRNAAVDIEVEVQKEVLVEVLVKKEVQKHIYNQNLQIETYVPWMSSGKMLENNTSLSFKSLTDICEIGGAPNVPRFSPSIRASKNFYQSYEHQEKYIGMYLKPVHALMFQRVNGQLTCTLLSPIESKELQPWVEKQDTRQCWMSTTQHTDLAGHIPKDVRTWKDYQDIIEQVRYFNGELDLLIQDHAAHRWLDQGYPEKLGFFESGLADCRGTTDVQLQRVHDMYRVNGEVYKYINEHPDLDGNRFDWQDKFPKCLASEIEGYKQFAKESRAKRTNKTILKDIWDKRNGLTVSENNNANQPRVSALKNK